jgi:adenosine kinase
VARGLKRRGVPVVIDPGQGLPLFERDELVELMEGASTYVVNDYEWSLTLERSGLDEDAVAARVECVLVTLGEKGAWLRRADERIAIPPVPAARVVDPTGAGDAFRAGFLFGRRRGLELETCGRIGSLLGSLAVEHQGTQALSFDLAWFRSRYERAFDATF